jgi:hypothetical protein
MAADVMPDLLAQIRAERAAACTWLAPAPEDPQDGELYVPGGPQDDGEVYVPPPRKEMED